MPYITSIERIGRERGLQQGSQQAILEALEERFGDVPAPISDVIHRIPDPDRLRFLYRRAIRCASLDEFQQILWELKRCKNLEVKNMPYITSVERRATEEGLKQGLRQGRLAEGREMVVEVLRERFGEASDLIRDAIHQIEAPDRLRTLLRQVIRSASLDEFQRGLNEFNDGGFLEVIKSLERIGMEKGLRQGLQQGVLEKGREMVIIALKERFGEIPAPISDAIHRIENQDLLRALMRRVIRSLSFEEIQRAFNSGNLLQHITRLEQIDLNQRFQQGFQQGALEEGQKMVIEALEQRVGRVPGLTCDAIYQIEDPDRLRFLHRQAIQSASLDDFLQALYGKPCSS